MPTALITGPTSGIGHAFARRLAADGWHLVLVARDSARLDRVADELRTAHGVEVETLPADLGDAVARTQVAYRLGEPDRPIELLINNAGYAPRDRLLQADFADQDAALAVLVRAVLQLSHAAARAMSARGHGGIINVSSVAGYAPRGLYSAAKAWVTNFSESLAAELADSGVRVLVTCPGFTRTEFHARAGFGTDEIPDFLWLDADAVAVDALRALARGRVRTIPGLQWKVIAAAIQHLPLGTLTRLTRGWGRKIPSSDPDLGARHSLNGGGDERRRR